MKCFRVDIRRKLSRYVHGELPSAVVKRVEDHLLDCGDCRASLARIKVGHGLLKHLPYAAMNEDQWRSREVDFDSDRVVAPVARWGSRSSGFALRSTRVSRFAFVAVLVALAAALVTVALLYSRLHGKSTGQAVALQVDTGEFHPVNIGEIHRSTEPHIVAEGYVSEVAVNDEDGDLSFKLVDQPRSNGGPFIVCEIIDPIRLDPPRVGSRVRVYGVSRYDNQTDHNWYEVHPVLNIEVVHP